MSDKEQRGPQGDRGSTGPHGHQGNIGHAGERGVPGARGAQGRPGHVVDSHMGRAYIFGLNRSAWALFAYVALGMVVAFGFYQQAQAAKRSHQQAIDADYRTCLAGNALREQVRNLVIVATNSNRGDITQVPGFEKLDKPTQDYLRNVANSGSSSEGFREQGLAALKDRECDRLYPTRSEDARYVDKPTKP